MPNGTRLRTSRAWQAMAGSRMRRVSGFASERAGDEPERSGGESYGDERVRPSVQRGCGFARPPRANPCDRESVAVERSATNATRERSCEIEAVSEPELAEASG